MKVDELVVDPLGRKVRILDPDFEGWVKVQTTDPKHADRAGKPRTAYWRTEALRPARIKGLDETGFSVVDLENDPRNANRTHGLPSCDRWDDHADPVHND